MQRIYTKLKQVLVWKPVKDVSPIKLAKKKSCEPILRKNCYKLKEQIDFIKMLKSPRTPLSTLLRYGCPTNDNLFQYEGHVLAYSNYHRSPLWVCECLQKHNGRSYSYSWKIPEFKLEESVQWYFRVNSVDLTRGGYNRGHMAAAANHKTSPTAMNDTFYMTNICAQNIVLNEGLWKLIESKIRLLYHSHCHEIKTIHILSGPLWIPREENGKKILEFRTFQNIAVPTHFFKVFLVTDKTEGHYIESYIVPNLPLDEDEEPSNFLVERKTVEKYAGFSVFDNVSDSDLIGSRHLYSETKDITR